MVWIIGFIRDRKLLSSFQPLAQEAVFTRDGKLNVFVFDGGDILLCEGVRDAGEIDILRYNGRGGDNCCSTVNIGGGPNLTDKTLLTSEFR